MGYTTEFRGKFKFNKPVIDKLKDYVNSFCGVRHMIRDTRIIKQIYPNWNDMCYFGNLGPEGEYFINDDCNFGQSMDASIVNYNLAPKTQPGLWCQWEIDDSGEHLVWNGAEKFYDYVDWLKYLIDTFFEPNGYFLTGVMEFQGEDYDDCGHIIVRNNCVEQMYDEVSEEMKELVFRDED